MNGSAGREDPLDRVLRATPLAGVPPTADACLDAETLAALVDGDLRGPARATAEQHAAGCERCQAALAALVRITPEPSRSAWWSIERLRWAVPVAATAAAVAIWVAVIRGPLPERITELPPASPAPSADSEVARAEPTPERREVTKQVAPPLPSSDRAAANVFDKKTNPTEPKAKLREKDADGLLQKAETDALARKEDARPSADPPPAQATLTAPAAPPPAPAVNGQAAGKPAAPIGAASRQEYAAAGAAGAAAPRADASAAAPDELRPLRAVESVITTTEVLSPDPRIRWRLSGQTVQRSTDGGATWVAQSTGTTARLNAGVSPSPFLCWVVGDDGLVLMTADGLTWQRTTSPAADSLVAVTASDADHATVTTRDKRAFVTADRGRTWTRRPTP